MAKRKIAHGGDALHLRLDTAGGVPIYLQLIEQIKYHIATGTLKADDELPSVRAVANAQLINPNTVARAYLELEREGVIYKRRGMGTYVAEKGVSMSTEERAEYRSQPNGKGTGGRDAAWAGRGEPAPSV